MRTLRSHLTYANVIATLALFLVLAGGAAFAATKLAKNSVKGKQIAPDAVGSSEAHDLTLEDFSSGESERLRGSQGDAGSQGIRGVEGAQGTQGLPGTPATIARTEIPVTGERVGNAPNYLVFTAGTFSKLSGSSRIDLTYATDISVGANTGCRVQLRIGSGAGVSANGASGVNSSTVTTVGDARLDRDNSSAPAVVLASFEGLPAGTHTVKIGVGAENTATTCTENDSSIPRAVIAEEVPPPSGV